MPGRDEWLTLARAERPIVYLLTRKMTDFDENMLDVVVETERFDAAERLEVDHDPMTHQLKVLRTMRFEAARGRRGDGHFEVLLRTRPAAGLPTSDV